MAVTEDFMYNGMKIVQLSNEDLPKGRVYVVDRNRMEYLQVDGSMAKSAEHGWFDSIEHAKEVVDRVLSPIKLGGE